MASNLSTIGFSYPDPKERAAALIALAKSSGPQVELSEGAYAVWHSQTGAQVWFYLAQPASDGALEENIVGLCPFFEGESSVPLKISEAVRRPGDGPFDGAFYGWVHAAGADAGSYPLVFDAVDFARHTNLPLPSLKHARISGFTQTLTAYPDAESYLASKSDGSALAPVAFLPAGLFASALDQTPGVKPAPTSLARLTGKVLRHDVLRNELTERPFHWILVQSLDATYDIVADPEVITGAVAVGGTVEVTCSLFGRVLDSTP